MSSHSNAPRRSEGCASASDAWAEHAIFAFADGPAGERADLRVGGPGCRSGLFLEACPVIPPVRPPGSATTLFAASTPGCGTGHPSGPAIAAPATGWKRNLRRRVKSPTVPSFQIRKVLPSRGASARLRPVMAPSSTDQTPGRPSQPVRSLPLNSDRKPGSSTAAAAAFRSVPAVAASASRARLPHHHRAAFTMPPYFLATRETLP